MLFTVPTDNQMVKEKEIGMQFKKTTISEVFTFSQLAGAGIREWEKAIYVEIYVQVDTLAFLIQYITQ